MVVTTPPWSSSNDDRNTEAWKIEKWKTEGWNIESSKLQQGKIEPKGLLRFTIEPSLFFPKKFATIS